MTTPQDFFQAIPFITRYQIAASLTATLLFATGVTNPSNWILDFQLVFKRFQIWRLLTNHFILGKGFSLLIRLLNLYKYGSELERGTYLGNTPEYSFALLFGICVETFVGYFLGLQVLSFATVSMIMYLWARNNHTQVVSLMGVLTLKAPYLPWAFVVLTVIMGGDPILELVGIFSGHVYWFLTDVLPKTHKISLLKTPAFWYALWGQTPPNVAPDRNRTFFGGHRWGQGMRLHNE
eukprot:c10283_g1_i1.p1 GENE.c10283_g1_i1~~c10283_g1_i1.p1  ORF type:complete len:248 (-),score=50.21 c10283_g1_i1:73-780(-)